MGFSPLTNYTIGNAGQYSSRNGARVDRMIIHHGATWSWSNLKATLSGSARTVSANYTVGNGEIVGSVDEIFRAFTSASASWDGRAVTVETLNSSGEPNWPVADRDFDALARLIADVARRHGFPINDNTILTHQELYLRYGAGYSTACPGDLQRRKAELLRLANSYLAGPPKDQFLNALPDINQLHLANEVSAIRGSQVHPGGYSYDAAILAVVEGLRSNSGEILRALR